jgi:predicted glycosyltransferase
MESSNPVKPTNEAQTVVRDVSQSLWVDLCSPSHPFLFRSIVDALDVTDVDVTVRKKTETVPLAEEIGFDFQVIGTDFDNRILRMAGIPLRAAQLTYAMPNCDVALCSRNVMAILAAKSRGIPSIHFTDNDITAHLDGLHVEDLYNRLEGLATHNVVPAAFNTTQLTGLGADPDSIHTYDGTKEDVYVAAFDPDPIFTRHLPFERYVVVRPEALTAAYVDTTESIVPQLLSGLANRDINVVYLPRGRGDEHHSDPYPPDRVYTPDEALNGLQLSWHADCVLTGSGTMAREAAAMGKPAVSFFPNHLLSVDEHFVAEGQVFHSRDPLEVVAYVDELTEPEMEHDRSHSYRVRREVAQLTADLVNDVQ